MPRACSRQNYEGKYFPYSPFASSIQNAVLSLIFEGICSLHFFFFWIICYLSSWYSCSTQCNSFSSGYKTRISNAFTLHRLFPFCESLVLLKFPHQNPRQLVLSLWSSVSSMKPSLVTRVHSYFLEYEDKIPEFISRFGNLKLGDIELNFIM